MAGIYIHIPFCKQACRYCDFHFSISLNNKIQLIDAMVKEISLKKYFLKDEKNNPQITTIYFGGGTPSLLDDADFTKIFNALYSNFSIANNAEITLEANPDDLNNQKLKQLISAGFNRLSIGIQSFDDIELKWMNRSHHAQQAMEAVVTAQQAGFKNISIDLIYGSQLLSDEQWEKNLDTAFALNVQHLSCYALTVEGKNLLAYEVENKLAALPDDEKINRHFNILMDRATINNFQHYEISNFCKTNFHSNHNTNYWKNISYIGIGPSAHGYNGDQRFKNIANNTLYINKINAGDVYYETEKLSQQNKYNEYIMTSLRTQWGCDSNYILINFGEHEAAYFLNRIMKHLNNNNVVANDKLFTLTRNGKFFADAIAADLFI